MPSRSSSPSLAIGIDMGGTTVKYGVVRGHEIIEELEPLPTPEFKGPKPLLKELTVRINSLQKKHKRITAVGMGVPGFADITRGYVHELSNVPGWNRVHVSRILTAGTGIPSFVENDANAMCYAEFLHGAGKGSVNMIAVTLGTGVGGGLVFNKELYRGSAYGAGEIGQMSIDYRGAMGEHGNIGALEKYVGNREVAALARELYDKARCRVADEDCKPRALSAAARRGDPVALEVWDQFTTQLAAGLCNCVWLLNPDRIVIGGGIARAGKLLFGPLKTKMYAQLALPFRNKLRIVPAKFGNDAGIIGNAAVATDLVSRRGRKH
jgi:glucokinase